jgi:hypothetical protein
VSDRYELKSYFRQYAFPGALSTAFHMIVSGDEPKGYQCYFTSAGLTVPIRKAMPIILRSLKATVVVASTGNQYQGLVLNLWVNSAPHGSAQILQTRVVSPFDSLCSWIGEIPNDWGFGVSINTAAGLGATHKLELSGSYEVRG